MAAETRPKRFHYKAARWLNGSENLQKRLYATLNRRASIGKRREALDREGKTARFINGYRIAQGMLCGMVVVYTQGNNQLVLTDDTEDKELPIEQLAPPKTKGGKRREFVEGLLYFAVKDNHVLLLQSQVIQTKPFTDHLNWLFQQGVPKGEAPNPVEFRDRPANSLKRKAIQGVKSILLRTPLGFETQTQNVPELESGEVSEALVVRQKDDEGNKLFRLAMNIINKGALTENYTFKEALQTGDIEIELRIVRRKRSTSAHPSHALDDIAAVLPGNKEADFTLDVPKVGKLKGTVLSIQDDFTVACPGGWPSPSDVFKQMHEWMQTLLERDIISAEA